MKKFIIFILMVLFLSGCTITTDKTTNTTTTDKPTNSSTTNKTSDTDTLIFKSQDFIQGLNDEGYTVVKKETEKNSHLSVNATYYSVDGNRLAIYEYKNEAEVLKDSKLISKDGSRIGNAKYDGVFHFYQKGLILVGYSGKDTELLIELEKILGKSITDVDNTTKLVNFSSSDIKSIDIYKFNAPSNAEKKIVTGGNDIKTIIYDLNSIKIKGNATLIDVALGGAMRFVFNRNDGTQFVIYYNGGTIQTPDGSANQSWYKIDDYSWFDKWENLNYSAQKSELPVN